MPAVWDAIFHLSNSMKHIFEVVPEKSTVDCPRYVQDCLYELLCVILEFIESIKNGEQEISSLKKSSQNVVERVATTSIDAFRGLPSNKKRPGSSSVNCVDHNRNNVEISDKSENNILPLNQFTQHESVVEPGHQPIYLSASSEKLQEKLFSNNNCFNDLKESINLSPKYKKIQEEVISNVGRTKYYCDFCETVYSSHKSWTEHFNESKLHRMYPYAFSNNNIKTCRNCHFTVYGRIELLQQLIDYHIQCHFDQIDNSSHEELRKVENPLSTDPKETPIAFSRSSSIEKVSVASSGGCSDSLNRNRTRNNFKISSSFIKFNSEIHLNKLISVCYCSPCDHTSLSREDWNTHCLSLNHIEKMPSKFFRNFEGLCTYCSLKIVGSERVIKELMNYHNSDHLKVLSYSLEPVSVNGSSNHENKTNENRNSRTNRKRNSRTNRKRNFSTYKVATDHEQEYHKNVGSRSNCDLPSNEYVESSQRQENTQGARVESSCSAMAEEGDELHFLQELCKSRVAENCSYFGGYCVPCEILIESGFDWIDHLDSCDHRSNTTNDDKELILSKANLNVYGNKFQLQKLQF